MADKFNDHLSIHPKTALRNWIAFQMMKGAGVAAALFFGTVIFIGIIRVIGRMLPENPNPIDPAVTSFLYESATALSRLV